MHHQRGVKCRWQQRVKWLEDEVNSLDLNDESIEPEKVIIHTSILEKFKDENLSEEALELKDILIQIYTKVWLY